MLNYILNTNNINFYTFVLGLLTVFSFQPFNFSIVNFAVLPLLFLIISNVNKRSKVGTEKNSLQNFFYIGYFFGIVFSYLVFIG